MDVVIDVYDRVSGEKVASQSVRRVYTHFAEEESFSADEDFVLPEDTLGFVYESEGSRGAVGTGASETSYYLQVRSKACATNYQPNSARTACVACPAPSGTKQYRSGDCTIGTCPTGQQANSAKTGCVAITCPSGQRLEGDNCVQRLKCSIMPCSHPTGRTPSGGMLRCMDGTTLVKTIALNGSIACNSSNFDAQCLTYCGTERS